MIEFVKYLENVGFFQSLLVAKTCFGVRDSFELVIIYECFWDTEALSVIVKGICTLDIGVCGASSNRTVLWFRDIRF
jgi:hypothetical protein